MNLERMSEIKSRKAELRRISDDISDTILMMSELNVIAFFSLLISMIIGFVMIYDKLFQPLIILSITEIAVLALTLGVKEYIKKDLPSMLKEANQSKRDLLDYKNGVNRHKEIKKTRTLSDKEIQSFIDIKAINDIYNEMQAEKKEEVKLDLINITKPKKEVKRFSLVKPKKKKIVITQDVVDEINRLFEEDKNIVNTNEKNYLDQDVLDQINALFKDDNRDISKHKIEMENSDFIKKRGVRR